MAVQYGMGGGGRDLRYVMELPINLVNPTKMLENDNAI